jgi:hypothetical protein
MHVYGSTGKLPEELNQDITDRAFAKVESPDPEK